MFKLPGIVAFACSAVMAIPSVSASDTAEVHPKVIVLFSKHCHAYCDKVRPILQELKEQYPTITFCELDTSQEAMAESRIKAKELGKNILQFMLEMADHVPYVGFFTSKGKLVKELDGPKTKEVYVRVIAEQLTKEK